VLASSQLHFAFQWDEKGVPGLTCYLRTFSTQNVLEISQARLNGKWGRWPALAVVCQGDMAYSKWASLPELYSVDKGTGIPKVA
jgi:hypothetical protein